MSAKKRNIIIIIIVAIVIIGGLSIKFYMDNIEKSRVSLLSTLKEDELNTEEITFLQNNKFIDENDEKDLKEINEQLKNDKIEKNILDELKIKQQDIYNKANENMSQKGNKEDNDFTKELSKVNDKTKEEKEQKEKIKTVIDKKVETGDTKEIIVSNINTIKEKQSISKQITNLIQSIEARAEIAKYGFDKNAILKGNYTSLAGTWVDKEGNEIIINEKSEIFLCNKFIKLKPAKFNGAFYTIFQEPTMSSVGCGGFLVGVYPIGVKYSFGNTNTSKVRLTMGNGIVEGDPLYYKK